MRCEHLQKQIHIANQRRTLLIEELDQNQQSIEASYNNRLKWVISYESLINFIVFREMEERCRGRIAAMEEKFRIERQEMQKEIEIVRIFEVLEANEFGHYYRLRKIFPLYGTMRHLWKTSCNSSSATTNG